MIKRLFYKIYKWWMRKIEKKIYPSERSNLFLEDIFNWLFRTDKILWEVLEYLDEDEDFVVSLKEMFDRRKNAIDYLVNREKAFLSYICNILQRYLDGEVEIDIRDHEKYVWSLGEEQIGKTTRRIWIAQKMEIPQDEKD